MIALIFWAVFALCVFWMVGAYNRLIRLRAQVQQKAQSLGTQLLQYVEWVKVQLPGHNSASIFAGQEQELETEPAWQQIHQALAQAETSLQQFLSRPLDDKGQAQMVQTIERVDQCWAPFMTQQPEVSAYDIPEITIGQWQAHLIRRRTAITEYNLGVQAFHRELAHAPELWLAKAARMPSLLEIHLAA